MEIIISILIMVIVILIFKEKILEILWKKFPYSFKKKKFLLTKVEKELYDILKNNLKEYEIMSKVRVIDLIEPTWKWKNYLIAYNTI